MVQPADAGDILRDAADGVIDETDRFRRRAALLVACMAALLAITGLGGDNATKQIINANIQASDTFAFFQAKNIRQTSNQLAADELEFLLGTANPPEEVRQAAQQRLDRYRATVARYESEPETGEGKQELLVQARAYERERDRAQAQDPNFDYAQALFQIAIILGSVAIIAVSRPVLWVTIAVGAAATLLMLNGYFLWTPFPFG